MHSIERLFASQTSIYIKKRLLQASISVRFYDARHCKGRLPCSYLYTTGVRTVLNNYKEYIYVPDLSLKI